MVLSVLACIANGPGCNTEHSGGATSIGTSGSAPRPLVEVRCTYELIRGVRFNTFRRRRTLKPDKLPTQPVRSTTDTRRNK